MVRVFDLFYKIIDAASVKSEIEQNSVSCLFLLH
jgi:hypothetical protein